MDTQFQCKNEGRRVQVLTAQTLNGIDYLEVVSVDEKTLELHFLFPVPAQVGPAPDPSVLTKDNFVIDGGVRVQNVKVTGVTAAANVLTLTVNYAGDFSTYTLRIVTSPTNLATPKDFDPQLSAVDFSFKVACPSDFDCQTTTVCAAPKPSQPEINYLAKDYSSFRRLMLDRMSVLLPAWTERSAADLQIAMIEMLAYVGDQISYYQDAVATEAYLATARRRISVRRHARLLNYLLNDGCNARAWVHIAVQQGSPSEGQTIPTGTVLLTRGATEAVTVATADRATALAENPVVFETMHPLTPASGNNQISFYTWGDSSCCLPKGATRASLRNPDGSPPILLQAGDLLLLEEIVGPVSGNPADADPSHRAVVRLTTVTPDIDPLDGKPVVEVEWNADDALPFPLCLTAPASGSGDTGQIIETSVARGNIVLADHGLTLQNQPLIPPVVPDPGLYRPLLNNSGVTFRVSYIQEQAVATSARQTILQDPHAALPAATLADADQVWTAREDLLSSDRFAPDFVIETEDDGTAQLRFGDGILGQAPEAGSRLLATYRIGNGSAGNLGAEAIHRLVWDRAGILTVRNPLPATGGTDPEALDQARRFAPQSFRIQKRAVTPADYIDIAQRHAEVQRAAARFRWTGSWYTVFVTIDRTGGRDVDSDEAFKDAMRTYIDSYRLAGYDIEINGPTYVPLDIALHVCVEPGYFQADVKSRLLAAFSSVADATGTSGFFYPDNFSFGQPLYLSQVYERAMDVDGVAVVSATRFQRFGQSPQGELAQGVIPIDTLEVVRLSNDPNFPENGKIEFDMDGGL